MRSLVWFRRDLRVADNSALYHACRNSKDGVIGLFVITPQQWRQHDDANCKVRFWMENLAILSEELIKLNIPLRIDTCDSFEDCTEIVTKTAREHKCGAIFANREYEVNELKRDTAVEASCQDLAIEFHSFHDRVIVPPREIKTRQGAFYSVFTPYRKVWDTRALEFVKLMPKPRKQLELKIKRSKVPTKIAGMDLSDFREDLWKPGEKVAAKLLDNFSERISEYNHLRDVPSTNGTSLISPYLAAGIVSPRQCMSAAIESNGGNIAGAPGPTTWISELTWRDFYTQVMVNCPRVSMHRPFKLKTEQLNWRSDKAEFARWSNGQTGYPIVDAGMRQLNRTGWMHNRLRMVTAMFLTKNLLIDWRMGEKYFMNKLIDGDLSANNGGWQWSASTGTDAVPYFRIFNPFSQSKRFDPDGLFIKKMCPELESVPPSKLHDPTKLSQFILANQLDYPQFVVDYKTGRERALKNFKALN